MTRDGQGPSFLVHSTHTQEQVQLPFILPGESHIGRKADRVLPFIFIFIFISHLTPRFFLSPFFSQRLQRPLRINGRGAPLSSRPSDSWWRHGQSIVSDGGAVLQFNTTPREKYVRWNQPRSRFNDAITPPNVGISEEEKKRVFLSPKMTFNLVIVPRSDTSGVSNRMINSPSPLTRMYRYGHRYLLYNFCGMLLYWKRGGPGED